MHLIGFSWVKKVKIVCVLHPMGAKQIYETGCYTGVVVSARKKSGLCWLVSMRSSRYKMTRWLMELATIQKRIF